MERPLWAVTCVVVMLVAALGPAGPSAAGQAQPGGPVLSVEPSAALVDGQTVRVRGSGFTAGRAVDVLHCAAGPPPDHLSCDVETAVTTVSDDEGSFELNVELFGVIVRGDGVTVDCRAPDGCALVATTGLLGPDEPGVAPLAFDPEAALVPPPSLTLTPDADLVDGQVVGIRGSGFRGGFRWVSILQCNATPSSESCRSARDGTVEVDDQGNLSTEVTVTAQVPTGEGPLDCRQAAQPCTLVVTTSIPESPRAGRAELDFNPGGPVQPDPEIEVTPSEELGDFTTLVVRGRHFTPGRQASVRVCVADPTPTRCDDESGERPTADPAGDIELDIGAWAELDGSADCRQPPGCVVVASDDTRDLHATVPLGFAPPEPPRGRYLDPVFDDVDVDHDVVYRETVDHQGNPVQLKMDIYRPAGDTATRRPVALWMHGGFFAAGDKSDMADMATAFARRGYVGVSLQYRLRPGMPLDIPNLTAASLDAYEDAVAATGWLGAHAEEYGIDPDAIVAGGWSAGAVLALYLAYAPGEHGPPTSPIAAALPVAGLSVFRPDPGEPPSLVFHSTADTVLPFNNADKLCPLARAVDVVCELVAWDGANHDLRAREVVRRGADFVAEQVLTPAGYFDVPAGCTVVGTEHNDILVGSRVDDVLCGLGGHDLILGGAGNDVLIGGPGNDVLIGGPGDDLMIGGPGLDVAIGTLAHDRCSVEIALGCQRF